MKMIKLKNGMVLRETNRYTDRNRNQMESVLFIDILYGEPYKEAQAALSGEYRLMVIKQREAELWASMKDMSRDQLMEKVFADLSAYKALLAAQDALMSSWDRANSEAESAYQSAYAEWESKKKEILRKTEEDPTYILTEEEKQQIESSPVLDPPPRPEETDPIEILTENGLAYLTDLVVTGRDCPELLDFEQIIEV